LILFVGTIIGGSFAAYFFWLLSGLFMGNDQLPPSPPASFTPTSAVTDLEVDSRMRSPHTEPQANPNDITPAWQAASLALGVRISTAKVFTHADGTTLCFPVHLPDFGEANGMLLWTGSLTDDPMVQRVRDVARARGCTVAVVNPEVYSTYDRELFISTLNDWGFVGPPERRPEWYTGIRV